MELAPTYVNIHTHRPAGRGIELRTVGIHPWDAGRIPVASLLPLDETAQAIGETGLDFARPVPKEVQYAAFRAQLELARQYGLPVVLHCVRAFDEVMRELDVDEPTENRRGDARHSAFAPFFRDRRERDAHRKAIRTCIATARSAGRAVNKRYVGEL